MANPYDTLRDTSGDIYNEIVEGNPEYRRLFWGDASAFLSKEKGDGGLKKSAYGMGNALNAGHVIGVSENLAHATYDVTKGLEQNINDINIPETDPAFKDFQRLKETFSIHNEHLGKIVLKVKHNRPKFDEGKIASGTVLFETDFLSLVAEGAKSNIGKKWESEAGNAVRRLKNKVLKGDAAWTAQMAIDKGMPVYVYDQVKKGWFHSVEKQVIDQVQSFRWED